MFGEMSSDQLKPPDPTCILSPGCHPFINRDTWVFYAKSETMSVDVVLNRVKDGKFKRRGTMSDPPLGEIAAGLLKSPFTPGPTKDFYRFASAMP